ncbi:MAG TPA: TIGR03089 family protein [Mycobacteriales bacterium]|nr:TIGR03089 family protein [Mycobacteriales bacterium]
MTTPADLLAAELRRDGARPFATYYNDASGERIELSVATTANWVAKTANLFIDEYDVEPGDVVVVRLPLHWQAIVALLASWAVGARVSFDGAGALTITTLDEAADGPVIRLALAAMGADFSRLVAAQPDAFDSYDATGGDLIEAADTELPFAARVLTVLRYDDGPALFHGLLGPLAVSGSVVLVTGANDEQLSHHARTEQVTHTLGVSIDDLPRLDDPGLT